VIFALDRAAAIRGGALAGQYLQDIGETDLAKLSVAQFGMFCERLVAGAMRAALDDHIAAIESTEPPF
jgi:hypothetical protein